MAPLRIDIWSDVACPWCFIGKRRLEKALEGEPQGSVEVRWHAFQLEPDLPEEGVDPKRFFTAKLGGEQRRKALFEHVTGVASLDGLRFQLEDAKAPNTRLAHRVVAVARKLGHEDAVVEALFKGHFEQGVDVGRLEEVLALLAREAPSADGPAIEEAIRRGGGSVEVDLDLRMAEEIGISGVPFFVAGGAIAMSGAQDVETFRAFLEEARRRTQGRAAE